ncbi:conserved unknown protein [Ectocarpus siliculosus]|uniref:DDE Tnp4 domain-containing protein n=1 Tax=Ectocarpus siliculosus TaxID=2880 RepID=D7G3U4_ECTSI|nr:conserved unknown protein [Ectocarpus siliculosus]|eukprot:CBJ33621.1 conserved unknown protein [Ectocarpus siliculosus]
MKFQGVDTPDGPFVDLWGPVAGTRHDSFILAQSGLMEKLSMLNSPTGHPFCLYGDPAYGLSNHLVCPLSASSVGPLTPEMADFNKRMSHCRVTVEWGFKEMTGKWAFVNMKPQQKFLLSPVAKHYRVATLPSNWHSCMNGGNEIDFAILWRGATHFRELRSGVSARCTHVCEHFIRLRCSRRKPTQTTVCWREKVARDTLSNFM